MQLTTALKGEDLFDIIQKEEFSGVIKPKIKKDPCLEHLIGIYRELGEINSCSNMAHSFLFSNYVEEFVGERLSLFEDAEALERFSVVLPDYHRGQNFDIMGGLFLSACMNLCSAKKIVIHTSHYGENVDYIGKKNNGLHIVVRGSVGDSLGNSMKSGVIDVYGNAGNYCGNGMSGGKIIVRGNVGHSSGFYMTKGIIDVKGEVPCGAGCREMLGGSIYRKNRRVAWRK